MIKFFGVCIGGPMAGEPYVSETPVFQVAVKPPDYIAALLPPDDDIPNTKVNTFTYEHLIGIRAGPNTPDRGKGLDFWIEQGSKKTVFDCLKVLVDFYHIHGGLDEYDLGDMPRG